jgi:ATP-dependent Clp protease protease subunit
VKRAFDIYSRLLKERIIFLGTQVNDGRWPADRGAITVLEAMTRTRISPLHQLAGRLGDAGMAIYDTMQYIRCDVATLCMGRPPPWRVVAGQRRGGGKRYALPIHGS